MRSKIEGRRFEMKLIFIHIYIYIQQWTRKRLKLLSNLFVYMPLLQVFFIALMIVVYSGRYIYSLLLPNIILLRRFMAFSYHLYLNFLLSATISNCKCFREEILGNQRFCVDRRQKNLFAHKGRTNRNKTVVSSRKLHGERRKVALVKLTSISETREGRSLHLTLVRVRLTRARNARCSHTYTRSKMPSLR